MATDINLSAVTRNITVEQGSSMTIRFAATQNNLAMDLTDYVVRFQVRRTLQDTSWLINGTLANGLVEWIDQAVGTFQIALKPGDTSAIRFLSTEDAIDGVYDIELQSPLGTVYKICKGTFTLNREVTR